MSALLALLLFAGQAQGVLHDSIFFLAQGRSSDVSEVEKFAKRCGVTHMFHTIVRGAEFKRPFDVGAELSAPVAHVSSASRKCMKQHAALLSRVYSDFGPKFVHRP
ncbi:MULTISPECIES: hypothetical protein [unclassified Sphingomonas]|nr:MULTISPECIES: hypothetical protein [unclassified Sphingomonas]